MPSAKPRKVKPKAKITLDSIRTGRPPKRSTILPARGPARADTPKAMEKPANRTAGASPRSRLAGIAMTAGR